MGTFTLIHVAISLAGIASGLVVLFGLFNARRLNGWTALFLTTTVLTSVTGFLFPVGRVLPSHAIGASSLIVLAVAIVARYPKRLGGVWRSVYVVGAVVSLYLNVFVLIVQLYLRVPALQTLAPTQTESPFVVTQLLALTIFAAAGLLAVVRFGEEAGAAAARPAINV
jgi:hypothetical protein